MVNNSIGNIGNPEKEIRGRRGRPRNCPDTIIYRILYLGGLDLPIGESIIQVPRGAIVKLGPNKYLFNNETLTFRGLCSTLEEMGVEVTYL